MSKDYLQLFAFGLLAIICLLNLNGLVYVLFGIDQMVSILIFASLLFLMRQALRPSACMTVPGSLFAGSVALYLFLGAIYSINGAVELVFKYIATYSGTLLIIYATACYVSQLSVVTVQNKVRRIVSWCAFAGAVSIFFTEQILSNALHPPMSTDRAAGFFANANEAGVIGLIAFVLMLWSYHEERRILYLVAALTSAASIFFTFSKSSIVGLFLVLVIYLFIRRRIGNYIFVVSLALLAFFLLSSPELWMDELTNSQITRIEQVFSILSGDVTEETTTGRTVLWAKGLSIAAENSFVLGEGLGSFHNFNNFVSEDGELGAHNTYLMLLGEAGLPVFLVFIAANGALLRVLWRERLHYLFMYFVILQIDFLSAHNVLGLRFHGFMIGYTLGVLAYTRRERKTTAALKIA